MNANKNDKLDQDFPSLNPKPKPKPKPKIQKPTLVPVGEPSINSSPEKTANQHNQTNEANQTDSKINNDAKTDTQPADNQSENISSPSQSNKRGFKPAISKDAQQNNPSPNKFRNFKRSNNQDISSIKNKPKKGFSPQKNAASPFQRIKSSKELGCSSPEAIQKRKAREYDIKRLLEISQRDEEEVAKAYDESKGDFDHALELLLLENSKEEKKAALNQLFFLKSLQMRFPDVPSDVLDEAIQMKGYNDINEIIQYIESFSDMDESYVKHKNEEMEERVRSRERRKREKEAEREKVRQERERKERERKENAKKEINFVSPDEAQRKKYAPDVDQFKLNLDSLKFRFPDVPEDSLLEALKRKDNNVEAVIEEIESFPEIDDDYIQKVKEEKEKEKKRREIRRNTQRLQEKKAAKQLNPHRKPYTPKNTFRTRHRKPNEDNHSFDNNDDNNGSDEFQVNLPDQKVSFTRRDDDIQKLKGTYPDIPADIITDVYDSVFPPSVSYVAELLSTHPVEYFGPGSTRSNLIKLFAGIPAQMIDDTLSHITNETAAADFIRNQIDLLRTRPENISFTTYIELDMHGEDPNINKALDWVPVIRDALNSALAQHVDIVRFITGQGRHSSGDPILRPLVMLTCTRLDFICEVDVDNPGRLSCRISSHGYANQADLRKSTRKEENIAKNMQLISEKFPDIPKNCVRIIASLASKRSNIDPVKYTESFEEKLAYAETVAINEERRAKAAKRVRVIYSLQKEFPQIPKEVIEKVVREKKSKSKATTLLNLIMKEVPIEHIPNFADLAYRIQFTPTENIIDELKLNNFDFEETSHKLLTVSMAGVQGALQVMQVDLVLNSTRADGSPKFIPSIEIDLTNCGVEKAQRSIARIIGGLSEKMFSEIIMLFAPFNYGRCAIPDILPFVTELAEKSENEFMINHDSTKKLIHMAMLKNFTDTMIL
ncbi:hypothetical protein TRFO_10185 [Tritrichomonas foetus]|uniref:CUE domain-containing protein n=1 Tax=Tritrichomonas foetus TaxID=1144522 RepID=A0A1J4JEY9_9EUKA|nr:hypothetical protein TRFO_10185 [Tritrichomonas foetus]|eukprot:OHS96013.1 hypothetical protein TRFO_10185 [Tritrichomonas foetus]